MNWWDDVLGMFILLFVIWCWLFIVIVFFKGRFCLIGCCWCVVFLRRIGGVGVVVRKVVCVIL